MAEPIQEIQRMSETANSERLRDELVEKLLENGDALDESLRLLKALHDRGVLAMLVGLVEQSDRVAKVAVEELAQPRNVNAIGSLVALYQLAGKLNPAFLQRLGDEVGAVFAGSETLEGENDDQPAPRAPRRNIGILGLWRQMRDPDVNRGLQIILDLLRGVGRADRG